MRDFNKSKGPFKISIQAISNKLGKFYNKYNFNINPMSMIFNKYYSLNFNKIILSLVISGSKLVGTIGPLLIQFVAEP